MNTLSVPFALQLQDTRIGKTDDVLWPTAARFRNRLGGIKTLTYAFLSAMVLAGPAAQAQLLSRPSTTPAASAPVQPPSPARPGSYEDVHIDAWETGRSQDDLIIDLIQACRLEAREAVDEAAATNRKTLDNAGSVKKAKASVAAAAGLIVFNKISWIDALHNAQVIKSQTNLSNPREAKYLNCIYERRVSHAFSTGQQQREAVQRVADLTAAAKTTEVEGTWTAPARSAGNGTAPGPRPSAIDIRVDTGRLLITGGDGKTSVYPITKVEGRVVWVEQGVYYALPWFWGNKICYRLQTPADNGQLSDEPSLIRCP